MSGKSPAQQWAEVIKASAHGNGFLLSTAQLGSPELLERLRDAALKIGNLTPAQFFSALVTVGAAGMNAYANGKALGIIEAATLDAYPLDMAGIIEDICRPDHRAGTARLQ